MEKVMVLHSAAAQIALAIRCLATLEAFFLSILRYVMKILLCFLCRVGEVIRDSDRVIIAANSVLNAKYNVQTKCVETINKNVHWDENKISILEVKEAMGELLCEQDRVEDGLFEEEVSLQEVREAFEVFDENKDGFIDAEEVQRVLCALGVMEASETECNGMIKAFDNDGDGRINFNEFTKIIEDSFQ